LNGLHFPYDGPGSKVTKKEEISFRSCAEYQPKQKWRNLIPANQQVMCERFPENKWALGLAALAFALAVGDGIIPA
jgi:hypothetical protein